MNQLLSKAYILGLRAMGERRRITLAVFLLAAVSLSMSVWLGATATATHVPGGHLAAVGPVNAQTHFAEWYEDSNGLQLKLCINDAFLCINDPVDPGNALSVESGFGAEAFWWAADAHMPVGTGGSALLVLAVEAAYANDDPEANAQMSFGRIRVRASGLVPGASYRVIHPYGEKDYVAEAGAVSIRDTIDIGCLGVIPGAVACDWNLARLSNVGPFLVWDPAVAPEAPPGAIGNPAVEHKVIGSPFGTNHFRIEGLNAGGPGVNFAQTDLFLVQGKLFDNPPTAVNDAVNIPVGSTARPIDVLANDSDRDGNTITVSAVTQPASGAVAIEAGAGRVIFTPGAAGSQTFNYTASSTMPGNPTKTAVGTVTVNVHGANAAPVAVNDTTQVAPNSLTNHIVLIGNDTDANSDILSVSAVTQPAHGTVSIDPATNHAIYRPLTAYFGLDSFTYTLSDGVLTSVGTVNITVDRAPTPAGDTARVKQNTANNAIQVLANDTDPDGHPLTVVGVGPAAFGTGAVGTGGTILYTPAPGFLGTDVVSYTVSDTVLTATAAVTVTVVPHRTFIPMMDR